MKVVGFFVSLLLYVSTTWAATDGNHVRGIVGFSSGALNIGADYENRQDNLGYGGYFLFSADEKDANKDEVIALGALASVHLLNNSKVDVYVAPGFGIAMIEPAATGDDETTFGPILKIGVEYVLNNKVTLGLQHMFVYNWLSDEAPSSASFLNAAATFAF